MKENQYYMDTLMLDLLFLGWLSSSLSWCLMFKPAIIADPRFDLVFIP